MAANTPLHDDARRQIAAILNRSREDANKIPVPEDGQAFTPEQRQALAKELRKFQSDKAIGVDGVVGRETLNALARAAEVENAIDTAALSRVARGEPRGGPGGQHVPRDINPRALEAAQREGVLETDRIRAAVKAANLVVNQLAVRGVTGLTNDGELKEGEVKALQRAYGLKDDGVIGRQTSELILELAGRMNSNGSLEVRDVRQALSAPPATTPRPPAPTERSQG